MSDDESRDPFRFHRNGSREAAAETPAPEFRGTLQIQQHGAAMDAPAIRLLEVAVSQSGQARWRWNVSEGIVEIAAGYEVTRKAAQAEGDSALFALLSISRK